MVNLFIVTIRNDKEFESAISVRKNNTKLYYCTKGLHPRCNGKAHFQSHIFI